MRSRRLVLAVLALLPLVPRPAQAGDPVKDLLAEAKSKTKEPAAAAALYGQAIAKAQGDGDLLKEQEAGEAFLDFLGSVDGGGRRAAVAAAVAKLDPKRLGAVVSAPLLAGELLLAEVATGDGKFAAEAATALGWHLRRGRSGVALGVLASFAGAVKDIRAGDAPKAESALKEVLARSVQEEWTEVSLGAGVELAALRLKGGNTAGAAEAVGSAAALVSPRTERRYLHYFQALVSVRLKDAPEAVLRPWENAKGYLSKDEPGVSAPAGAGADGSSGAGKETPFGAALKSSSKAKFLATAVRTKEGFDFRIGWDPKFRSALAHPPGTRHLTEGGLTIAFADRSVGMREGNPVTGTAAPGADASPAPGRAFYRLAEGETWTLLRDGVVQITGK